MRLLVDCLAWIHFQTKAINATDVQSTTNESVQEMLDSPPDEWGHQCR